MDIILTGRRRRNESKTHIYNRNGGTHADRLCEGRTLRHAPSRQRPYYCHRRLERTGRRHRDTPIVEPLDGRLPRNGNRCHPCARLPFRAGQLFPRGMEPRYGHIRERNFRLRNLHCRRLPQRRTRLAVHLRAGGNDRGRPRSRLYRRDAAAGASVHPDYPPYGRCGGACGRHQLPSERRGGYDGLRIGHLRRTVRRCVAFHENHPRRECRGMDGSPMQATISHPPPLRAT